MSNLFISYASDDQAIAMEACALLEAQGIRCWIAPRDVSPGAQWDEAIVDAITSAGAFLLILTTSANGSPYVKNEVNHAFAAKKPIFTFRVEDVQPSKSLGFYLARHHWTDGFPARIEPKLAQFAAAVTDVLGEGETGGAGTPVARPAPSAATRLGSALKARRRLLTGVALGLAAVAAGAVGRDFITPAPAPPPIVRFEILPPAGEIFPGASSVPRFALSPDGRFIAYQSDESGRREVYVRPFPDVETGRWQVSTAGGSSPVWAPSGREIFFRGGGDA